MTAEDKKYVLRISVIIAIGVCLIVSVFIYNAAIKTSKNYTDEAIRENNKIIIVQTDSIVNSKIQNLLIPKLDTIIRQQDTIINRLNK